MVSVRTATGEEARVIGQGHVEVLGPGGSPVVLKDVLYVPSFKTSLIFVSSAFDSGGHIQYIEGGQLVNIYCATSDVPVLQAEREGDLWSISTKILKSAFVSSDVCATSPVALVSRGERLQETKATLEDWHCRLGHLGWRQLRKMFSKDMVRGAEVTDLGLTTDKRVCAACLEGKMTESPFASSEHRASKPFERIHMDLMGPMEKLSIVGHHRYVMCIVDKYSR